MKNKSLETIMYSAVGVGAMLLLLLGLNIVAGAAKQRIDLTAEKAHTLSDGTRKILEKLDTTVKIRFYCTQVENATAESVFLSTYARQVEDLLEEFRRMARGKIVVEKFDPQPDSDAEDSARLDGVEGQPMPPYGENFYLGLTVSVLDERVALPFLSPTRERLLEYDLARAVSQVLRPDRPVIGVMSALPVMGMAMNPMMMQMGRQQGQDPWIFISELKRDFTVKEVPVTSESIDADVQLLIVLHPRDITEIGQYAIDQFVLRGGKLVAFLDPLSFADNRNNMMNPLQRATSSGSTLDKLIKAWGLEFDVSKCVSDMAYKTTMARGGRPEEAPAVLSLSRAAFNQDDLVMNQLDNMLLPYAGVFTGTPAAGLTQTVLMKTSPNSMLIDKVMAEFGGGADKDFKASGTEYALAVRLTGKFKTAFPDGKPAAAKSDASAEAKPDSAKAEGLKESAQETMVVLVGDSDVLFDPVVAQVQNLFGQKIVIPQNGNLNFGQSLVELLAGDSNLIGVRSRASLNRPFTVVKEMQERAQQNYRSKIRELEESLQETQRKLNELQQSKKEGQQRFILSEEQQRELERFRHQEAATRKELKELRRNLQRDVDALENRLKWTMILAMPMAVTLSGIVMALYKRKKTAAQ